MGRGDPGRDEGRSASWSRTPANGGKGPAPSGVFRPDDRPGQRRSSAGRYTRARRGRVLIAAGGIGNPAAACNHAGLADTLGPALGEGPAPASRQCRARLVRFTTCCYGKALPKGRISIPQGMHGGAAAHLFGAAGRRVLSNAHASRARRRKEALPPAEEPLRLRRDDQRHRPPARSEPGATAAARASTTPVRRTPDHRPDSRSGCSTPRRCWLAGGAPLGGSRPSTAPGPAPPRRNCRAALAPLAARELHALRVATRCPRAAMGLDPASSVIGPTGERSRPARPVRRRQLDLPDVARGEIPSLTTMAVGTVVGRRALGVGPAGRSLPETCRPCGGRGRRIPGKIGRRQHPLRGRRPGSSGRAPAGLCLPGSCRSTRPPVKLALVAEARTSRILADAPGPARRERRR